MTIFFGGAFNSANFSFAFSTIGDCEPRVLEVERLKRELKVRLILLQPWMTDRKERLQKISAADILSFSQRSLEGF
uniref:Uncharacterized protein n=1 Tax=Romanomermis culicivorax TaxID=13658 RepID=A0A915K8N7_ROMCU